LSFFVREILITLPGIGLIVALNVCSWTPNIGFVGFLLAFTSGLDSACSVNHQQIMTTT
jgi:hypothetical protein